MRIAHLDLCKSHIIADYYHTRVLLSATDTFPCRAWYGDALGCSRTTRCVAGFVKIPLAAGLGINFRGHKVFLATRARIVADCCFLDPRIYSFMMKN